MKATPAEGFTLVFFGGLGLFERNDVAHGLGVAEGVMKGSRVVIVKGVLAQDGRLPFPFGLSGVTSNGQCFRVLRDTLLKGEVGVNGRFLSKERPGRFRSDFCGFAGPSGFGYPSTPQSSLLILVRTVKATVAFRFRYSDE